MTEPTFDPENLRAPEYVCEPDPRSTMFVKVDRTTGTHQVITLADHRGEISAYASHTGVRQEIVLQFETAKKCVSVCLVYLPLLSSGGAPGPRMPGAGSARAPDFTK